MISQKEPQLGEQGIADVDQVDRDRLTTLALFQHHNPGQSRDALRMRLDRGTAAGWFRKFPMPVPRDHYYVLGPRAIRTFQRPGDRAHRKCQGFSHPGLINHLSIAYLCVHHGLIRLRPSEMAEHLADHCRPGLPSQNYLLRADGSDPVLYWAIVDIATPAKEFPVKVGKAVAKRFALPAFAARIRDNGFAVAIITGNENKAQQIEGALAESDLQFANVGVLVVPEIEPLQLKGATR